MGWDVVQIGLKHDLPVEDPIATAELVAKRMNRNIKLVYGNKYVFDKINNTLSKVEKFELIEIAKFTVDSSKDYFEMTVSNYQANQILKEIEGLRKTLLADDLAKRLHDDIHNQFELYEIETEEIDIRIFRENVDLDVFEFGKWHFFEHAFYSPTLDLERLLNYRMKIYERARMFGCKEVIICSDQGPTMEIYDHMDYPAEQLKQYTFSNRYYEESNWLEPEDEGFWKSHARKIKFSSVFNNELQFKEEEFVEIVYDDFKDLILRDYMPLRRNKDR